MNVVTLTGNLTKDPELKTIEVNGKSIGVVNFCIATSRFFKKADGSRDKDVTFIQCEAWDSGAETISKIFKKGDPMLLQGSLKVEQWEKDGIKRTSTKVRVNIFEKLARFTKSEETLTETPISE